MEYHYFVAGLPDLSLTTMTPPSLADLLADCRALLSKNDLQLLEYLLLSHDNQRFLSLLNGEEPAEDDLCVFTIDEWKAMIAELQAWDTPQTKALRPYFTQFFHAQKEQPNPYILAEDLLASFYYDWALKCKNRFLSEWFSFNLNTNNILTAAICKRNGYDKKHFIVGHNDVAEVLRYGKLYYEMDLQGVYDHLAEVNAIADEPNLLEREHKLDLYKWTWLDEQTFFEPFSVEAVLAYWIKCELLARWQRIVPERGVEILRGMLQEAKNINSKIEKQ